MSVCESAILISMLMPHPKGKKEWEEREKEAHTQAVREGSVERRKEKQRTERSKQLRVELLAWLCLPVKLKQKSKNLKIFQKSLTNCLQITMPFNRMLKESS